MPSSQEMRFITRGVYPERSRRTTVRNDILGYWDSPWFIQNRPAPVIYIVHAGDFGKGAHDFSRGSAVAGGEVGAMNKGFRRKKISPFL
jgi:hypothetical protein